MRHRVAFALLLVSVFVRAQLPLGRDTITVREAGYVLKMPWANGLNFATFSNIDLNFDGVKDLVAFDRINLFGVGRFRCFLKSGSPGEPKYKAAPGLSYSFPEGISNWAILADYNCDGKEDIFCSTPAGIMVYRNVSTPTLGISFELVKPLLYSFYSSAPTSSANLPASPAGVPGIADVDGDGDLDILTFAAQGVFIEYHRNMSMETYGHCDSLDIFKLSTSCWGKLKESDCQASLNESCGPRPWEDFTPGKSSSLHAGSCITCLDSDSDGDQDLILGDIACNVVQYAHNTGVDFNGLITDTTKLYPNYPAKNNTQQIRISNFPCAYHVDVDGDGKRDLIASPNVSGSENAKSVWYYRNVSNTPTVNFQFQKNNFLQDEMIEVGQSSFPVLFDFNADGKKDLLVGTYGYYSTPILKAQLCLYANVGTNAQPSFSLVSRDYASLSTYSLNFAIPAVGDIDGDGDTDILLGSSGGQIHWLKNSAGPGNVCNFSTLTVNAFSFTPVSGYSAPQLFDINNDGKLDLMLGGKNGRISYYMNTGTGTSPSFSLVTNSFGNVNVQGSSTVFGIDGYSVPFFYKEGQATRLLVGSVSGQIFHYSVPTVLTSSCVLLSAAVNGINEGAQSAPFYEDINGDNIRDLFVGNGAGGLSFFSSKAPDVGIKETAASDNRLRIFPVPAADEVSFILEQDNVERCELRIYDLRGILLLQSLSEGASIAADLRAFSAGIYIAELSGWQRTAWGLRRITARRKIVKG